MTLLAELKDVAAAPHGQARSLPFAAYRDEALFDAELTRVFHDDWVFACAARELVEPGDYYAFRLGAEPVVILHGQDGELRALSNVCRHRGTQLLDDGFGHIEKLIVCPYHAWAYDDAGDLRATPFAKEISVDRDSHCLPRFAVHEWLGLLFVNLGDAPTPFPERLSGIERYLAVFDAGRFTASSSGPIEVWDANWKLIVENAIESYHLFKVHEGTLEVVTPTRDAYYVAGNSEWAVSGGKTLSDKSWFGQLTKGSYPEAYDHYLLVSLPPSFIGVLGYDSFAWLSIHPVGVTTTVVRSGGITSDLHSFEDSDSRAFTEAFFAEDKAICERVQRSMGSTLTRGGQLVDMERIVVDFHRFLANRLFDTPALSTYEGPRAKLFLDATP